MGFQLLTPAWAALAHMNVRTEMHGDEQAAALDLKFSMAAGNAEALGAFYPDLCAALYCRTQATEDQAEIEGVEQILPNLRFPRLGPLSIDQEIVGATVTISYGIDDGSAVVLHGCKVNKFRLELAEGGTVTTSWRVQCGDIPDGALDKLGRLLGCDVDVMVVPPEAQADDEPEARPNLRPVGGQRVEQGEPESSATDLFVAAHKAA